MIDDLEISLAFEALPKNPDRGNLSRTKKLQMYQHPLAFCGIFSIIEPR